MIESEECLTILHEEPEQRFRVLLDNGNIVNVTTRHGDSSLVRSYVIERAKANWQGREFKIVGITRVKEE